MAIDPAPWYAIRRAQNLKPTTYTCPFCRGRFPALLQLAKRLCLQQRATAQQRERCRRVTAIDCNDSMQRRGKSNSGPTELLTAIAPGLQLVAQPVM